MINLDGDREWILWNLCFDATAPWVKTRERMRVERARKAMGKRYKLV